jgi:hypothetical protein
LVLRTIKIHDSQAIALSDRLASLSRGSTMPLKHLNLFITNFFLLLISTSANAQIEPPIPNIEIPNNSTLSNTSFSTPTLPLGDINQQGGIINNNGTLGQTNNCGRACINFYTDFSRNDFRFGANLSIPLFVPENELTSAQAKRTLYDVESEYIKTISEACQSKDFIRAELSVKGLARIWNRDYKSLSCGS